MCLFADFIKTYYAPMLGIRTRLHNIMLEFINAPLRRKRMFVIVVGQITALTKRKKKTYRSQALFKSLCTYDPAACHFQMSLYRRSLHKILAMG